jgi:hypothetical protein
MAEQVFVIQLFADSRDDILGTRDEEGEEDEAEHKV